HFLAIGSNAGGHRGIALRLARAVVSPSHPNAGHQPTQIPLPGTRMSLIEVVQVDDEIPFRRSVETEVAQMGITADHGGDTGRREMSDVLGYHDRGTAQETVR